MPFSWDDMPYTNFHELNIDWFINKFKEIFAEWTELYNTMVSWKEETQSDISEWENEIEDDISDWETGVISDLNDWKDNFEELFNTTFNNLTDIKTDAESARDRAEAAADSATASAESVAESAEDIEVLKYNFNKVENTLFKIPYIPTNMTTDDNGKIFIDWGYINASTGASSAIGSSSPAYKKYLRSQSAQTTSVNSFLYIGNKSLYITLGLDWVQWTSFSYTSTTNGSATHSNSRGKYIPGTESIFIPKNSTDVRFTLGFRTIGASDSERAQFTDEQIELIKDNIKIYILTDDSLSIIGSPADAKSTGDLINNIMNSTDKFIYKSYDYNELVEDDGIPTGSTPNGHLTNNPKYCRTSFLPLKISNLFKIVFNNDTYQWRIVTYKQRAFVYGTTNLYKTEYTNGAYEKSTKTYYVNSHSDDECYLVVSFRRTDLQDLEGNDYDTIESTFKIYAMIQNIPQNFQSVQNSPAAVYHMINTAETYMGRNDIWYGTANVAYSARVAKCLHGEAVESESGKFNIDCSTFVTLCLRGTPFEKSRYITWDSTGSVGNGSNTETGGYIFDEDSNWYTYRVYGGGEMLANQIAKYAYEHGYLYKIRHRILNGVYVEPLVPNIMCKDIRPGDLIFRCNANQNNYYWMDIGHVMLVADIDNKYIYFYEAMDSSESGIYYSPTYKRRALNYLDGNDVFFGARFPLAERGTYPYFCNIADIDSTTMISVLPTGISPEPVLTVPSNGTILITGNYSDLENPLEYRIPFTAPSDAICSYGIKETDSENVSVSVYEVEDNTPTTIAKCPDGFADSHEDACTGKCKIENSKNYYLIIKITSITDSITLHPYIIKDVTFNGYKTYIGNKFELDENIANLLA